MAAGLVLGVAAVTGAGGGVFGIDAVTGAGLCVALHAATMAAMTAAPAARHVPGNFGVLFNGCLPKTIVLIDALQCWQ
jgi:hypothetical protein